MTAPLRFGSLPMMRISLSYIYDLAASLEPLENLPEKEVPWNEIWLPCIFAQTSLENLHINSPYAPFLRSSSTLANTLNEQLKAQLNETDQARTVPVYILWSLREAFRKYKIVLQADLGVLHSYFVTQKGGFDTLTLLMFGESLFPAELATKVPEALFDAREAGKCLAYESPTACGFHAFRTTESVLRRYYSQVSGSKALPKNRNIGVYLNAMKNARVGDEKIMFSLKQMADLYRNPLVHPDAVLTQEDAIGVFGLARSAIGLMLSILPVVPPTTSTALAAQSISVPSQASP